MIEGSTGRPLTMLPGRSLLAKATEVAINDCAIIPSALPGQHLGHEARGLNTSRARTNTTLATSVVPE